MIKQLYMFKATNFKIILIICLVFSDLSCKENSEVEKGFVINGKINGDYKGYVFLYKNDKKDSTLVSNQHFQFKGKVSQPTEVSILTKGFSASSRNFFIENTKIFIDLNWTIREIGEHKLNWLEVNSVEGTKTSKLYKDFEKFKKNNIKSVEWKTKLYQKLDQIISDNPKHPYSGSLLHNVSNDTTLNKENLKVLYNKLNLDYQAPSDIKYLKYKLFTENNTKVGDVFKDFSLPNNKKENVNSIEFRSDSYVLFDFWASWCKPCRKQFPELKKIAKENKYHDFKILGISLDAKKEPWLKTIKKDSLNWKNVIDTVGFDGELALNYKVREIPYNIFVDKKGRIIGVDVSLKDLKNKLDSIYKLE